MTTYLFPGQGAQVLGMGKALFDEFPILVEQADDLLGYSLAALCLEDKAQQLNQTQYTQPALYVVNALAYLHQVNKTGQKPDYAAGHSLGEYNALFAAEAFDFVTGLQLVQKRGALMSAATGGAMLAVVGLPSLVVQKILQENKLTQVGIANDNSYTQVVISGSWQQVEQAAPLFEAAGAIKVVLLKVSGAFHSPFMQEAQIEFAHFLAGFSFSALTIPVIANLNARPYQLHEVHKNLTQQISHPVNWTESMAYLIDQGEEVFEEIGPGKVLAGLVRRIKKGQ